jgi:hypothetical protein
MESWGHVGWWHVSSKADNIDNVVYASKD